MNDSPGHGNALALPAGQGFGLVCQPVLQPHFFQDIHGHGVSDLFGEGCVFQCQFDVLDRGKGVKEIMGLEDKPHLSAHRDQSLAGEAGQFVAEDGDRALLNRPKRPDQGEEGGLSGAGGSGHDHDLSGLTSRSISNRTCFLLAPVPK